MKKLGLLILVSVFGVSAWAADAQEALNFYKKELSSFPVKTSRDNRAYALSLADGLNTWVLQHEKDSAVPTARLLQARLLAKAQENGAAFVTLLQLRYMFPQVDVASLKSILEESLNGLDKNVRQTAQELFTKGASAKATELPQQEAESLYALSKLSGKNFYPAATQAFERFFVRYPNYAGNNEAELWYGDLHRLNGNYLAAIAQYKKADALYPNSPYKAASLRLIGDIYADNLKDTDAALNAYTTVLRLYPKSSELGIVYKHMAILDENNKQYDSALINYDKAIELLGDATSVHDAYRGKADVYLKTKQYEQAYTVLHQAAALPNLPKAQALQSLQEAANIARKRLKDDVKYTQSLEKAILLAPGEQETAPLMYELANAYEKQGKTAQAQELYKKLILQFPTGKYASGAQSRLDRLNK
ncbi:MAG: tetratricopeptide repeat protein [Elusimicrobiaceae bacterium]|nr:tetratricopeptide repeat protein [Elusimicrobiaceae bacterium]